MVSGLVQGGNQFEAGNVDVADINTASSQLGADDDEAPTSVGRDVSTLVALSEKAVKSTLNMVAGIVVECSGEVSALW